MKFVANLVNL